MYYIEAELRYRNTRNTDTTMLLDEVKHKMVVIHSKVWIQTHTSIGLEHGSGDLRKRLLRVNVYCLVFNTHAMQANTLVRASIL